MSNEMKERPRARGLVVAAAALLALGIAAGAYIAGRAFVESRRTDRFVTVKGVAERTVDADLVVWPLRIVATNDDLALAQAELTRGQQRILEFLEARGVDPAGVAVEGIEVTDRRAERYGAPGEASEPRFIVQQTLIVRSTAPDVVHAASQRTGDLVNAGVVLSSGSGFGPSQPTFLFTKLNDLKPEMIAEATRSAREAAEQFAQDSGSHIGGIRRANQGVFEILPRDQAPGLSEATQRFKTVRVVSTIEYYLAD